MAAWTSVFANAALPQKMVLLVLIAALPLTLVAAALALRRPGGPWRALIARLGAVAPLVGLLTGALNGYHMSETIRRVPFEPTAKQLGPGIAEISAVVGLGAGVGLLALAVHCALGARVGSTSAAP